MIIYTNEGNPLGLKLVLAAKLAKKDVQVKFVTLNDPAIKEPKHLPCLELDSGSQIFMSDVAIQFLMSGVEQESNIRNQWLEWSTTKLAPVLAQNLSSGSRVDPNAKVALSSLIKQLNEALKKSTFLTGDKVSSADISVWSLLTVDGALKGLQDIDVLLKWFKEISEMQETTAALVSLPQKSLNFSSFQQANRFGGLNIVESISNSNGAQETNSELPSPVHEAVEQAELDLAKASFVIETPVKKDDPKIVLPKPNERNILITSALPYVNNVPHLGNIIGCVLSADIFARYSRLCGYNTLYVSGTDEYGTATETKALAENMTPKQICDKYFEIHNGIYRWFGIGFDYFGRTSTPEQTEIVQEFFLDLHKQGFIETQAVDQLLCVKCDRFLADRFVEGTCPHPGCGYEDARGDQCDGCGKLINAIELIKPRCKVCNASPVVRTSNQLFIDLPKIEPKLRTWIETVDSNWTHNARVITKAWLKEGLKSRCITRDLKWGIPVPMKGFESKVFYVWFDAPIGYVSITSRYTKEWRQWWQPKGESKVELFQFMAKDNVPFHSVMFPSTLLGINKGHTLVSRIMATEYLNYEDGKFSKSRGIGVFGNDAQETGIDADVWRFYLAAARPEGQDSSFSWNDLAARNNSELLNNLGNFVNRALVFCEKNFDSTVGKITLNADDLNLLALINREVKGYTTSMEKTRFRDGIKHLLAVSRQGNIYMQVEQPWVLLKGTDEQKARAGSVISLTCNIACLLATLLFPFMPSTSRKLYSQLNVSGGFINASKPQISLLLPPGHKINKPVPLFTKIDQTTIDELKKKYGGVQQAKDATKPKQEKSKLFNSVDEAEKAVADQGLKVRDLKASGVEKAVWQPEVTILLELKKQLANLQAQKSGASDSKDIQKEESKPSADDVKKLEDQIAQQGEKVRVLKTSGADKASWQPEVEILLSLKQKLTALTGKPAEQPSSKKKKK